MPTTDQALELLAKSPFSASTRFEPYAARFAEGERVSSFPIAAVISEALPFAEAMRVFREARRERGATGLSPVVVSEGAFENLEIHADRFGEGPWGYLREQRDLFDRGSAERFFERAAGDRADLGLLLEKLLSRLEKGLGRPVERWLHRLDPSLLGPFEGGEIGADELLASIDEEGPDDDREAFVRARRERDEALARARAEARGAPMALVELDPPRPFDAESALDEIRGGRSHVALFGCEPHLTLLYLGFGDFNDCPAPHEHALVWKAWADRFGAEPVHLSGGDRLEGLLARPCARVEQLIGLTREVGLYDADALVEGLLPLAARLFRNAGVGFWWD